MARELAREFVAPTIELSRSRTVTLSLFFGHANLRVCIVVELFATSNISTMAQTSVRRVLQFAGGAREAYTRASQRSTSNCLHYVPMFHWNYVVWLAQGVLRQGSGAGRCPGQVSFQVGKCSIQQISNTHTAIICEVPVRCVSPRCLVVDSERLPTRQVPVPQYADDIVSCALYIALLAS